MSTTGIIHVRYANYHLLAYSLLDIVICVLLIDPRAFTQNVPRVRNFTTPIVLDGLNCEGTETNLGQCGRLPFIEYCTHSNDVGANCTVIKGWQH